MCDRLAYLCSSPFDPLLIKFNTQARLTEALARLSRSLEARQLMEAGSAADVLRQYLNVKRWLLTENVSGADNLPVVENVFALWMAFPQWLECLSSCTSFKWSSFLAAYLSTVPNLVMNQHLRWLSRNWNPECILSGIGPNSVALAIISGL